MILLYIFGFSLEEPFVTHFEWKWIWILFVVSICGKIFATLATMFDEKSYLDQLKDWFDL